MFDLISIGDAVIDTFIPLNEDQIEVSGRGDEKKLCLPFAEKIPVGASLSLVAGNAANTAVGASRLGLHSAIYVNIGADLGGERIIRKLKQENVNTRYIVENKDHHTPQHFVLDFKGERTILVYHEPWEYLLPDLDRTKWVYLTSLSPSFVASNVIDRLISYLERTGARVLYNPGTYQIKLGVKKNPRLMSQVSVFAVNREEAKIILGYKESEDISVKKLLKEILDLGPKIAIITDGENGSYGADGKNFFEMGIFPAKLREMTGAGDAYAVGLLAGLFYGQDLPEAMCWGAANGASVIEEIGPQKGLLTFEQMQIKLKEYAKITAKIL